MPKKSNPLLVVIDASAAFAVARHLETAIPMYCPPQDVQAWADIRDALYAIQNDSDAIVTDPADLDEPVIERPHEWSFEDEARSGKEGWLLRGGIERVDNMHEFKPRGDGNPIFASDEDALAFVQMRERAGSDLHCRAMAAVRLYGAIAGRREAQIAAGKRPR